VITFVLLALFGLACLWLIVDGMRHRGGIFEFGFLAGSGLFGFLFPEALGVVRSPAMAPEAGVWKALVMSALCAVAVYLGWKAPVRAQRAAPSRLPFTMKWMYRCGVACIIAGLYGTVKLIELRGGVLGINAFEGSHPLVFQGLPVMYVFFQVYGYLGLVLVALIALRLRSWLLAIPLAVPLSFSLANIVFAGRRGELMLLCIASGCVLYFARNITPARLLGVALAVLATLAVFLAPAYRGRTTTGNWGQVRQISTSDTMHDVLSGERNEFWSMAYLMEIADTQGLYQFGAGFYNAFVGMFVPKLIVGDDFKAKLFLNVPTARTAENDFGWVMPYGMVPTGPYTVFEQFWYFGVACYFFLARWMKRHWVRAREGDFWSQVVYSATIFFAVVAVVNDFYAVLSALIMFILPLKVLTALQASVRQVARPYCYAPAPRPWPRAQPSSPRNPL
jgi:hypothetical protein